MSISFQPLPVESNWGLPKSHGSESRSFTGDAAVSSLRARDVRREHGGGARRPCCAAGALLQLGVRLCKCLQAPAPPPHVVTENLFWDLCLTTPRFRKCEGLRLRTLIARTHSALPNPEPRLLESTHAPEAPNGPPRSPSRIFLKQEAELNLDDFGFRV